MIIVIEGISAAGKTTWCRQRASEYLVKESYPERTARTGMLIPVKRRAFGRSGMQNDGPTLLQWSAPKVSPFATPIR